MFNVGEKIIYGENGVCTVEKIAPGNKYEDTCIAEVSFF